MSDSKDSKHAREIEQAETVLLEAIEKIDVIEAEWERMSPEARIAFAKTFPHSAALFGHE
jgi:hypothetical protein